MNIFHRPAAGYDPSHDGLTPEELEAERLAFEAELDAEHGLIIEPQFFPVLDRCFNCAMKGGLHRLSCPTLQEEDSQDEPLES